MQELEPLEVLPPACLDHLGLEEGGKILRIPFPVSLPAPLLQSSGIHEGLSHWNGNHALEAPHRPLGADGELPERFDLVSEELDAGRVGIARGIDIQNPSPAGEGPHTGHRFFPDVPRPYQVADQLLEGNLSARSQFGYLPEVGEHLRQASHQGRGAAEENIQGPPVHLPESQGPLLHSLGVGGKTAIGTRLQRGKGGHPLTLTPGEGAMIKGRGGSQGFQVRDTGTEEQNRPAQDPMQESQVGGFCSRGDAGQGYLAGPGIDLTGDGLEERVLRQLGKQVLGSHINRDMNSGGPGRPR